MPPLRDEIASLIGAIDPHDPLEAQQRVFALRWIGSGAPLFRTHKPATPEPHLVAYFPLIDAVAGKILLVEHRNAGLWLPAGGHVEPDEHPRATVEREVREELDIEADFVAAEPFFITVTKTSGSTARHTDVSLWYVLSGDTSTELRFDAGEFFSVRWFAPDEIPHDRAEPHLRRFLSKLSALLPAFTLGGRAGVGSESGQ
jgi:8-oxo-dGTP diphosphatase